MDGPSVKCVLYKTFFVFHKNLMKLGRIISCTHGEKQYHQFLSNYDEKQKSFKYKYHI